MRWVLPLLIFGTAVLVYMANHHDPGFYDGLRCGALGSLAGALMQTRDRRR